ncbi:MAG: autoinducer binding domain-containing protein [Chloroflexi bacterium]|nr:autoinducer binding domain-containing protein [Chloroflexota bacterium]
MTERQLIKPSHIVFDDMLIAFDRHRARHHRRQPASTVATCERPPSHQQQWVARRHFDHDPIHRRGRAVP